MRAGADHRLRCTGSKGIAVTHDQSSAALPDPCDLVVASAAIKPTTMPGGHWPRRPAASRCMQVRRGARGSCRRSAPVSRSPARTARARPPRCSATCSSSAGSTPSFIVGAHLSADRRRQPRPAPIRHPRLEGRWRDVRACSSPRHASSTAPSTTTGPCLASDQQRRGGSPRRLRNRWRTWSTPSRAFARTAARPRTDGGRLLIAHEGAPPARDHRGTQTATSRPSASAPLRDVPGRRLDPAVRRVGVLQDGMWIAHWTNALPGEHNALNAAAAVHPRASPGSARTGSDVERRRSTGFRAARPPHAAARHAFAVDGGEVVVYDDYGHHPTEIEKTLQALRRRGAAPSASSASSSRISTAGPASCWRSSPRASRPPIS